MRRGDRILHSRMDSHSDRRRALKDLVDAALKVDLDSRGDFIRDASDGDVALRDEALALLETIYAEPIATGRTTAADSDLVDEAVETTDAPTQMGRRAPLQFPGTSRFEVRRRLGSGAFGTVYECHDREQQQSVALKVLRQTDPA